MSVFSLFCFEQFGFFSNCEVDLYGQGLNVIKEFDITELYISVGYNIYELSTFNQYETSRTINL